MADFSIWVDAQLSPRIARWLTRERAIIARPARELGLREAEDDVIFEAARNAGHVVVLTKDSDFVRLLEQRGTPPQVLWLTCGNTSNAALEQILSVHLDAALGLLAAGEPLVEITGP